MGETRVDFSKPLFDFIRDSRSIATMDDLIKSYERVVSQYGFDVFLCTDLIGRDGNFTPKNLFGKVNRQWEFRYFKRGYFRHDACLKHLRLADAPFTWGDVIALGTADEIGQRILDEASEFKAKNGVIVPIRAFDHSLSVVSLMGEHVDTSDKSLSAIEVASIYFRERGRDIHNAATNTRPTSLSNRQREIVQWLALGKGNADIADILGLSVKTIDRHIDLAKRRYGLTSTPQLVLAAFKEGVIEI